MPSKYIVKAVREDTFEQIGEYNDAIELALAMWELGLKRPEFDSIQVQEIVQEIMGQPAGWVEYLTSRCKCSTELAVLALRKNGTSVIHAKAMLDNDEERRALEMELGL